MKRLRRRKVLHPRAKREPEGPWPVGVPQCAQVHLELADGGRPGLEALESRRPGRRLESGVDWREESLERWW